ncbi:hypothetical protein J4050_00615 [Winogradskyella sp. DF17]|uniref:Right handed beta helix domain-containing protein n=1 Tax=Winogradskyella pelagia TaxID=2819984 RepID=A0ABS3SXM8_9FLAO|nr:hypothetical protein [Winogradskyella sp. DF17]MBO3115227.1 hypothetical protein [Winogradskyella sp. DF17]
MKVKIPSAIAVAIIFTSCVKEYNFIEGYPLEDDSQYEKFVFFNQEYSIQPNSEISESLQQAVDELDGATLVIDAGTYYLDCPIVFRPKMNMVSNTNSSNILNPPGLKIQGDGLNSTIFINRTSDYAFLLLGVTNENNDIVVNKFQTNGFFSDFSIYSPSLPGENGINANCNVLSEPPKGGVLMFGCKAFSFNNFGVAGFENNLFSENGIYIPLLSPDSINYPFEVNYLANFGNYVTHNSNVPGGYVDINVNEIYGNPDYYASTSTILSNVEIDRCKGYGIKGENGVGFNFNSNNLKIYACQKGGIYFEGHLAKVEGGLITGCGFDGTNTSAGIILNRRGVNSNGFTINNVEFDGNNNHHIWIKPSTNSEISYNRFVNNQSIKSSCKIGGFYNDNGFVSGIRINNNFFRYSSHVLSNYQNVIELNNYIAYSVFRENTLDTNNVLNGVNNSNFYQIKPGFSNGNNLVIHNGSTLIDNNNSPFFIVDNRDMSGTDLVVPNGSNRIKLNWTNVIFDTNNSFDLINDHYLTTSIGYYSFNLTLGINNLSIGKTIKIDFGYEESGAFIPLNSQFYTSTTAGYSTIVFSTNVYISSPKNIEVRITNNSGEDFQLLSGPNVTNFSGNLN